MDNRKNTLQWIKESYDHINACTFVLRGANFNSTPIICYAPNGEVLEKYLSVKDASNAVGIDRAELRGYLNRGEDITTPSASHLHFEYAIKRRNA